MATASAPTGGQTSRPAASTSPAESCRTEPDACRVHSPPNEPTGRANTATPRIPDPSSGSTTTCTSTPPKAGSTNGATTTNSSTTPQPTSSPARTTTSKNAVPGTNTTPPTT